MAIFSTYPVKSVPTIADQLMIADASAAGAQKLIEIGSLPVGYNNTINAYIDSSLVADDPAKLRFSTIDAAVTEINATFPTYEIVNLLFADDSTYTWTIPFSRALASADMRLSFINARDAKEPTIQCSAAQSYTFEILLAVKLEIYFSTNVSVTNKLSRGYQLKFDGDVLDTVTINLINSSGDCYIYGTTPTSTSSVRVFYIGDVIVDTQLSIAYAGLIYFNTNVYATRLSIALVDLTVFSITNFSSSCSIDYALIYCGHLLLLGNRVNIRSLHYAVSLMERDTQIANVLQDYLVEFPYAIYAPLSFGQLISSYINFYTYDFTLSTGPSTFPYTALITQEDLFTGTAIFNDTKIYINSTTNAVGLNNVNFPSWGADFYIWKKADHLNYDTLGAIVNSEIRLVVSDISFPTSTANTIYESDLIPVAGTDLINMFAINSKIYLNCAGVYAASTPVASNIFGAGLDGTAGFIGCDIAINDIIINDSDGAGLRAVTLGIIDNTSNNFSHNKVEVIGVAATVAAAPAGNSSYTIELNGVRDNEFSFGTHVATLTETITFDFSSSGPETEIIFKEDNVANANNVRLFNDSTTPFKCKVTGGYFYSAEISTSNGAYYNMNIVDELTVSAASPADSNTFVGCVAGDINLAVGVVDNIFTGCSWSGSLVDLSGNTTNKYNSAVNTGTGAFFTLEEDIIPIAFVADGTTAPDATEDYVNTNAKCSIRKFSGVANNDVIFQWPVPKYIDTSFKPQFLVEYIITEAVAPILNEIVAFSLAGYSVGNGDNTTAAFGAAVTSQTTHGGADAQHDRYTTAQSGDITVTNLAAGELAFFNLTRLATTTDTYAQKVGVVNIKIFWKKL